MKKTEDNKCTDHFNKFKKIVSSDSEEVIIILKCHLLVEYYLDKLIESKILRGDIITKVENKFYYREKLIIVEALDVLSKDLLDSLKRLNTIRNKYSHFINYQISDENIKELGLPLKKHYLEIKKISKNNKDLLYKIMSYVVGRFVGEIMDSL